MYIRRLEGYRWRHKGDQSREGSLTINVEMFGRETPVELKLHGSKEMNKAGRL